jgi:hypothetical protein
MARYADGFPPFCRRPGRYLRARLYVLPDSLLWARTDVRELFAASWRAVAELYSPVPAVLRYSGELQTLRWHACVAF